MTAGTRERRNAALQAAAEKLQREEEVRLQELNELSSRNEEQILSSDGNVVFDMTEEQLKIFTGFCLQEIYEILSVVENSISASDSGRGRKTPLSPLERLVVLLTFLKTYPTYAFLGTIFHLKANTAENLIRKTAATICKPLKDHFIRPIPKKDQLRLGISCPLPEVALIIDCSVQQCCRPTGSFADAKSNYSGKHEMYCWKREYAHLPNGLVAFLSPVFPGSVHDMSIFYTMAPSYEVFLLKTIDEINIPDPLPAQLTWAILADKGYVGANERLRCVTPIKSSGTLTLQEREYNDSLSKSRVICENFYGRMKQKFRATSDCFKNDPKFYDLFSDICVALTNFDIIQRPLRQEDYRFHTQLVKNTARLREEKKRKRHEEYLRKKERQSAVPENPFTATPSVSPESLNNWYRNTQ